MARKNFQEALPGIQAIVKSEPAFLEENMPAQFARQRRAGFSQFGLHERVPGLPHQGFAAGGQYGLPDVPAALDVIDNGCAGMALQDIARQKDQLPIGPYYFSFARDRAQADRKSVV